MITVPEAAQRTGLSPETIRRWIRAGKLPATKVGTQHLIDEADLARSMGAASRVGERPVAYQAELADQSSPPAIARRVVADPSILGGKPVIRGTRISVELVLDLLAAGWTDQEVLAAYPRLTHDDVRACLAYAAARVRDEALFPIRRA